MTAPAHESLAGRYELVSLLWEETTSKPGEPVTYVRHVAGDLVDLDDATARRLLTAGAVVEPGARERAAAQAAKAAYEAALAALPDDVRSALQAESTAAATDAGDAAVDAARGGQRPPQAASKAAWEAYGETQGLDGAKLKAAGKRDIVDAFRDDADPALLDAFRPDQS